MKQNLLAPLTILTGLVACIALMALSNLFTPIVQFIHTGTITPLQAIACLLLSAGGFWACYLLLNNLCAYFVPRMEKGHEIQPETLRKGEASELERKQ